MSKKPKNSRNSFSPDFNSEENDFILVDLDINQNEDDLTPVPLNNFLEDEEVINSLLVPQDLDDKLQYDSLSKAKLIDDIDVSDEFLDVNQFNIGTVEEDSQNVFPGIEGEQVDIAHTSHKLNDGENLKEAINQLILDSDYDLDPELLDDIHETIEIHDFRRSHDFEYNLSEHNLFASNKADSGSVKHITESESQLNNQVIDNNIDHAKIPKPIENKAINEETVINNSNLKSEITDFNNIDNDSDTLKKQLMDYEKKINRASRITNVSLGFGVITLLLAVAMGWIALNLQGKVSKLTDLNSILEENMGDFSEKTPTITLNNNDQIIGQENPNQPLDTNSAQATIIETENKNPIKKQLASSIKTLNTTIEKPANEKKPSIIDNKPRLSQPSKDKNQSSSDLSKNDISTIVKKPVTTIHSVEKKKILKPTIVENTKPKEEIAKSLSKEKISTENKPGAKEAFKEKPPVLIDESKKDATEGIKKSSLKDNIVVKQNTQPTPIVDNKQSSEPVAESTAPKNKLKTDTTESQWSVNLIAFEDQAIAKSKAAKFIEKGIQAKIIDVKVGNKTWYQLKTRGFKTKESAESYADKVKKSENLNAVSVSKQ